MDPISVLLTLYTLGGLITIAIAIFGIQTIIIATGAFLGLAGYFSSVPFTGVLGNTSPRVIVFEFVQQLVYLVSGPLILLLILSSFEYFELLTVFYLPIAFATIVNARRLPKLQTYESMVSHRTQALMVSILKASKQTPFLGLAMIWGVLILEWTALVELNPTLPLVVWLLLSYAYALALLMAAYSHGVIFQATRTPFVKVITRDQKEIDAFVIGKGSDHYVLTTNSGDMVIQSDYVERMVEQQLVAKEPLVEPKA